MTETSPKVLAAKLRDSNLLKSRDDTYSIVALTETETNQILAALESSSNSTTTDALDIDLIEKLAELEHEQWATWATALVQTEALSEERIGRWKWLMVPYSHLTEAEKEADRVWARKVLALIRTAQSTAKERKQA